MELINRFILNKLQQEINRPEVNILLGARQVGKTTLLHALEQYAQSQGYQTAFFDLEQPQVLAEFNRSSQQIINRLKEAGQIVFIDEFQYLANASKIFKALYDSGEKIKIICSGSSSLEIHKHLQESLAGRRILFHIDPLLYSEIKSAQPQFALSEYLAYGGMPALTHTHSDSRKQMILSEFLSAYILKDVKSLVREESISAFNHLLYLLAQNQGSLVSVHSLSGEINMSAKTVARYLDILEQTFVSFHVYSYSTNLGNELKKSFKTYFYDTGIRNAILRDYSQFDERCDQGALLESMVFMILRNRLQPNMEIKFWRTKDGAEVDFILLKNRRPIPIEVKSRLSNRESPPGLKKFIDRYPDTPIAYVFNLNQSGEARQKSCCVKFLTFEELTQEYHELFA